MELTLKKNNIPFYKKQAESSVNHEEMTEMIVPDSLPDIQEVLDADGTAVLRSKESENGKITISGFVRANVIYVPDGGGASRGLNTQIPFTVMIDSPEVNVDSKVVANADLSGIEARALNSRKLAIRAYLTLDSAAYGESSFSRSPVPEEYPEDLEMLTDTVLINPVTDIADAPFSISEELALPTGKPPISQLIKSSVNLTVDEYRVAGAKLIVKGTANVLIVYESIGITELVSATLAIPFSEVIDLADSENADQKTFDVSLVSTGIYIQEAGGDNSNTISVEITGLAQVVINKKTEANFISDAYSIVREADIITEEHNVPSLEDEQIFKETVRETLQTAVNARNIICVRVFPGGAVRATDGYNVSFKVCVTYCSDEGQTLTANGKLSTYFEYPGLSDISDIEATTQFGEPFAAPVAGGIEVRVPVELHTKLYTNVKINPVSEITMNDEQVIESAKMPSIVLYRVSAGDTLWNLAKRYNSTRDTIQQTNELESSELSTGQMLAIAKKR